MGDSSHTNKYGLFTVVVRGISVSHSSSVDASKKCQRSGERQRLVTSRIHRTESMFKDICKRRHRRSLLGLVESVNLEVNSEDGCDPDPHFPSQIIPMYTSAGLHSLRNIETFSGSNKPVREDSGDDQFERLFFHRLGQTTSGVPSPPFVVSPRPNLCSLNWQRDDFFC